MGIGIHGARSLIAARARGVPFGCTLTLGRQDLDAPFATIEELLRRTLHLQLELPPGDPRWRQGEYLFRLLGAKHVDALDASSYDGAKIVHDLNRPIPEQFWGRYDVVFDGGTLEHVFNFPTAIQSCMRMVKPGGRVIIHTPGNNWFGHGFYQFAPDLFFRIFSEANGFAVEAMRLVENFPPGRCYSREDPARAGHGREVYTVLPILLMVEAMKTRDVPHPLESPLYQSAFAERWESDQRPEPGKPRRNTPHGFREWKESLLYRWALMREVWKSRRRGFEWQRDLYTRLDGLDV
jgi:SAM-dependent methyltransferase